MGVGGLLPDLDTDFLVATEHHSSPLLILFELWATTCHLHPIQTGLDRFEVRRSSSPVSSSFF